MKYSATVRDLAAKNAHWRYYDENFRFLRQKSLFPWDEIQWELWLQAHHLNRSSFQTTSPSNSTRQANSSFREAIVGNFIMETRVSVVISNTNVLNAEPHIKYLDVGSQKIQSLPQLLHAQSAPTPLPSPL